MEMNLPDKCNNAPKQKVLFNYVKEQMLNMKMDTVNVIYLMSHGKMASILCMAYKDNETFKVAYFAEFQNHKKDSDINEVTSMIEKISSE
ncbi:hypothetical protein [Staphylococcus sp. IVB6214]|uniref:hypothetical protein n=1 Tax=Staphylococcus sp. IVB6214 TaxID=2989766 RepID=UPI0021D3E91F|nr:hypothetical protein [Staphylococcus sp. IVB6214]UXR81906.1 hypothetical protein MUA51_07530 [Staphylococcus sp. IVB6214]